MGVPMRRRSVAALVVVALISAACTDGRGPEPEVGNGAGAGRGDVAADAADAVLPAPFEIVSATATERGGPDGAIEAGFFAVAGAERSDPRVLEVTYFDFANPNDLTLARDFVNGADQIDFHELENSGARFVFLPEGAAAGETDRSGFQLASGGPVVESLFRADVGPRTFAVGAARILQPADVDVLLPLLTAQSDGGAFPELPLGLQVLVDRPLADGAVLEVESDHGTTIVEIRDDVSPGWFDYLTWDDPQVPPPAVLAGLGVEVSVAPPAMFGIDGEPTEPGRVTFWTDDRLITITHPPELPTEIVARLFTSVQRVGIADALALGGELGPRLAAGRPEAVAGRRSEPPDAGAMAELQRFVEQARGRELDGPVTFEFVEAFPADAAANASFISEETWLVLSSLGLIGPGQDRRSANDARREQLRGVPGVVALQTSEEWTNLVVVHELTHLVDEAGYGASDRRELVDPAQALGEGNAHRIAFEYLATLDADAQERVPPEPAIFPQGGDRRLSPAVQNIIEFAYDEGRDFAVAVAAQGGEDLIEQAFRRPPTSSEQILFHEAWLREDEPVSVEAPEPPEGADVLGVGSLGAYVLLLAIDDPLTVEQEGRSIVSEWAGDGFVLYEGGGSLCVEATVEMDTDTGADRLATALGARNRSVRHAGTTVRLSSCA